MRLLERFCLFFSPFPKDVTNEGNVYDRGNIQYTTPTYSRLKSPFIKNYLPTFCIEVLRMGASEGFLVFSEIELFT